MKMNLYRFAMPMRHTFRITHGATTVQNTLIIELIQDGVSGFGESNEFAYYGATVEKMMESLEAVRPMVEGHTLEDPTVFWGELQPLLKGNPFAHCALDIAATDLWGKLIGRPVWDLWGLSIDDLPPTDYTIGIDSIDVMVQKMREFPEWPVYKIKLGTDQDIEIVKALRNETDATFRIDANCGWTADETIRNAEILAGLGVEFLEQPLHEDDWVGMKKVFRESVLPIIADESCQVLGDVERCYGFFHGVNVKLGKCGGMTPARRMIDKARQLGLKVMVGCFCESWIGISAIAQLLPLLDYVDMDGSLLLDQNIATGVKIERGQVIYPTLPGCGAELLAH